MFYDDNGFRDMFIYGSIAMLAALALPSTKAHAAEIYLCNDGRMIELTNASRTTGLHQDSCVTSWHNERQKSVVAKSGGSAAQVAAAVAQTSAYQIQTSAIDALVNAVEVPESPVVARPVAWREKSASERRVARRAPALKSASLGGSARDRRSSGGLRHMGDGIFAE